MFYNKLTVNDLIKGIDYMKKNYPDYKGEDFLNWDKDEEDENNIY
jgi:hypothetical protein